MKFRESRTGNNPDTATLLAPLAFFIALIFGAMYSVAGDVVFLVISAGSVVLAIASLLGLGGKLAAYRAARRK